MKRSLLLGLIMLVAAGCATWTPVSGQYSDQKRAIEAQPPDGWLKMPATYSRNPLEAGAKFTRQGYLLQVITLGVMEMDKELLNTRKTIQAGMLPQEAAEVVLDSYRLASGLLEFEVLSDEPGQVGGYPGFRIAFDMKLPNHMWRRMVFYGVEAGGRFYFIHYTAPRRHYFDQDVGAFEEMVKTYRPAGRPAAQAQK